MFCFCFFVCFLRQSLFTAWTPPPLSLWALSSGSPPPPAPAPTRTRARAGMLELKTCNTTQHHIWLWFSLNHLRYKCSFSCFFQSLCKMVIEYNDKFCIGSVLIISLSTFIHGKTQREMVERFRYPVCSCQAI